MENLLESDLRELARQLRICLYKPFCQNSRVGKTEEETEN